ncbi:hypothetical protein RJ640_005069 [Escallonia rubra]|uniref:Knottins-like domain-containing protein n=1 Tax=Escallonia rubra TaxID=112253 RepID=A0AA88QJV7_9ASTE|nr:hypothetical protein RJ640_005069 [Escallonia rubra]
MEIKQFFGLILLLLFLLASQDEVAARTCESQSQGFKGACLSDHNCALVCKDEGFTGGQCSGARDRCFCTKIC